MAAPDTISIVVRVIRNFEYRTVKNIVMRDVPTSAPLTTLLASLTVASSHNQGSEGAVSGAHQDRRGLCALPHRELRRYQEVHNVPGLQGAS